MPTQRDERLIGLIVRAFANRDQLAALSETDVAVMPETALRHLERTARLSYLAPTIITSILDGTQPRALTARTLLRLAALPIAWADQRRMLGFSPA